MGESPGIPELHGLPAWKNLGDAIRKKIRLLEDAIEAKENTLRELAQEIPQNPMGGWFSGAGNESLEIESQFMKIKDEIKKLHEEIAKTIRIDTKIRIQPGKAGYGSLVVVSDPRTGRTRVFRLVLMNEEKEERLPGIEHVELGSPLANSLLGISAGAEFKLGIWPNQEMLEVVEVI
jgi:transcription elongation GreA/GreB family factor